MQRRNSFLKHLQALWACPNQPKRAKYGAFFKDFIIALSSEFFTLSAQICCLQYLDFISIACSLDESLLLPEKLVDWSLSLE